LTTDTKVVFRPHGHVSSVTPDGNPNPSDDVNSIRQSHSSGSQTNVYLLDTSSLVMMRIIHEPTDIYNSFQGFFYVTRNTLLIPLILRALCDL